MMWKIHLLLLVWWTVGQWTMTQWTTTNALDHVTSSSWRLLASQRLDAFQAVTRGRSKVECTRECKKYSHCNSFVFNASSHTCYLLPALNNVTDREHLEDKVYVNVDRKCSVDHAPESNGSVAWSQDLHSIIGKVTCYDDFINTTDDVSVQCLADGSWQREGMCLRHIWRNPPLTWFPIDLPTPVEGNWSVCVDGFPTLETGFIVELLAGPKDLALHADFRIQVRGDIDSLVLAFMKGGNFEEVQHVTALPLEVGQPFHLRITATVSADFLLYVDNNLLISLAQHPDLPATAIKSVYIRQDVNVTSLDLWCQF